MTVASNIVVEWLRSLHLSEYAESFIDNGYDDLEICKQISEPDLDAIGVLKQGHRHRLLQSVKRLREEGAASVYFTLEESNACLDDENECKSTCILYTPDKEQAEEAAAAVASLSCPGSRRHLLSKTKFLDEYEEGKAELVRIPRMQLRLLLQEKLRSDGIRLSSQPYTTPEGECGYLEGLASRYADLLKTHYSDVLEPLEELRRRETNISSKISNTQLSTSHSQPIYVPGKYSPSSCLSNKEEDEIYGFGYGIFGRQMMQQKQQKFALTSRNLDVISNTETRNPSIYQSCLSPRSAFFYEFPPNARGHNTSKKRTTFSRILRGLKTHKKDKNIQIHSSPKHISSASNVPQRVDTPDSVLQSGLDLNSDASHAVLRSMVDPRDYERLKYLRMKENQNNSFAETIQRLKVSEALKKKERFTKEHEEILRDIRQGLMQFGSDNKCQYTVDDTYMYDEEARCSNFSSADRIGERIHHWYDEPPYESDPEDFLMCNSNEESNSSNSAVNDRVCYRLHMSSGYQNEGVISVGTAGDISLPKERSCSANSTIRGLIVPQGHNNLPTIIPLTHSRISRGSGEYASSEVQSRSSEEEDNEESLRSQSTDYEDPESAKIDLRKWHIKQKSNILSPMLKNSDNISEYKGTSEGINVTVGSIAGRARNLRQDVQRKISRLRQQQQQQQQRGSISDATFPCSASSVESLPSGSGSSSTQALVRADSNHSSISCEERELYSPQKVEVHSSTTANNSLSRGLIPTNVLCRARALVDCMPNPYDKDALVFKKGDVIDVMQMNASGLWKGVAHNRLGYFKFINVEIINERIPRHGKWGKKYKQKPGSVPELLQRMNLQEYISVFLLNGYEDLELFRELEPADLNYLRIQHPEHRAKILTAVQLLHDLQSNSEEDELGGSSSEMDEISSLSYNASKLSINKIPNLFENNLNAEPTDNQSTEFQANVPLCLPLSSNASHISTPID